MFVICLSNVNTQLCVLPNAKMEELVYAQGYAVVLMAGRDPTVPVVGVHHLPCSGASWRQRMCTDIT
jgi:hypothetical protein